LQIEPVRLKLSDKGAYSLPQILDLDPEDLDPSLVFVNSHNLQGLLKYEPASNCLIYNIPPEKPSSLMLNK